jgi:hypothetical protein
MQKLERQAEKVLNTKEDGNINHIKIFDTRDYKKKGEKFDYTDYIKIQDSLNNIMCNPDILNGFLSLIANTTNDKNLSINHLDKDSLFNNIINSLKDIPENVNNSLNIDDIPIEIINSNIIQDNEDTKKDLNNCCDDIQINNIVQSNQDTKIDDIPIELTNNSITQTNQNIKENVNNCCDDIPIRFIDNDKDFNELKGRAMNETEKEKFENTNFYVDGLIAKGLSHFFYGASGCGKTSISLYLCKEIALNFPFMKIVFCYIDGSLSMAAKAFEYFASLGIQDRILVIHKMGTDEYKSKFTEWIDKKKDLRDYVIFYDTFKYLTKDINNKTANKQAMELIKQLQKLGATFISLGHTNKDNKMQSGTAEIEQDSDAIFRVDSIRETDGQITSTIKQAGRVRFNAKIHNFKFYPNIFETFEHTITIEDEESENEQNDSRVIEAIKQIIIENPMIGKTEITKKLAKNENLSIGQNKAFALLEKYNNKHWKSEKYQNINKIIFTLFS